MWDALRTVEKAHAYAHTKMRKDVRREHDAESGDMLPVAEFWIKDPATRVRADVKRRRLIDAYLGRVVEHSKPWSTEIKTWASEAREHRKSVAETLAAAHKRS
jgi:hypothetical protein